VVRPSIADERPLAFCATWGVAFIERMTAGVAGVINRLTCEAGN
jgi:hypothetical protein